jgi:tetratricopeptide (TPR) repeat protein
MNDIGDPSSSDKINSNETSSTERQQAELQVKIQQARLKAELQQVELEAKLQRARLEAELQQARPKKFLLAIIISMLLVTGIFVGILGYILINVYTTARNNELLIAGLVVQADSLESALAQTALPQGPDQQIQSLAQEVAFLRNKIDSELAANKISIEAMRDATNRIFLLFVFLSGVGSLFGIATWYSGRQEQQEEKKRDRSMFALQEKNLEEVNTITTAIAAGATQNVESLNTILETIQKIMDFKVSEAENVQKLAATNVQELVQKMEGQLEELEEAQRQEVKDLLRKAVALRRPRFQYANPDPDLQRQMVEFRTQVDLMQQMILHRHTDAESPKAENRDYGEIYLRRGVIAYYDNDVVKSREMLKIAERYFPFSEQAKSASQDQRTQTAFIQFYLALIEKNYGDMKKAGEYIENSYEVYGRGQKEQKELLTILTRAEIFSYLGNMEIARAAIQEVLDRADKLRQQKTFTRQEANYALRARLLLGNIYYIDGEWTQALQQYEAILEQEEALTTDASQSSSYYTYHSIAQVHDKLDESEEARRIKGQAYEKLLETNHLRTKTAMDTRILLNALAYLCTREDEPGQAQQYEKDIQDLWLQIGELNGLQLRLFSFEQKRQVNKGEFLTEIFGMNWRRRD